MNEKERLSLNSYMADLYQAMQIGDIVFESKHSSELYDLINKLLEENQKLKSTLELYKGSLHREHEAVHRANDLEDENQELKNQQKEFIEWLKEKSYQTHFQLQTALIYEKVLSKYKEIIGDKYE